jgi:hypothetical protein
MKFVQPAVLGLALCLGAIPGCANVISLTGSLNPTDSGDVFLFQFTASNHATVLVQSYGFGGSADAPGGTNAAGQIIPSGGFDTYLSLFSGIGPSATFLSSNDDGICPPAAPDSGYCLDSRLVALSLPGGDYTLALTVSGNMSFAENQPTLYTLGDGFIGLQQPDYYDPLTGTYRTSNWALDLQSAEGTITPIAPAPEPAGYVLASAGMLFILADRFLKRRR